MLKITEKNKIIANHFMSNILSQVSGMIENDKFDCKDVLTLVICPTYIHLILLQGLHNY